jgi:DNA mismatch endonuclease (patch repair protein)
MKILREGLEHCCQNNMPDHMTRAQRSFAMKRVKLKNGSIEKLIQRELTRHGLTFRRHVRSLHGSPDIVFTREKIAVFIDGDFWHGWRLPVWEHKLTHFWRKKLHTNRARDLRNFRRLRSCGWIVIRLWEHQIKNDVAFCAERVLQACRENPNRSRPSPPHPP